MKYANDYNNEKRDITHSQRSIVQNCLYYIFFATNTFRILTLGSTFWSSAFSCYARKAVIAYPVPVPGTLFSIQFHDNETRKAIEDGPYAWDLPHI